MEEEDPVLLEPIVIGLTRPPMMAFIPFTMFGVILGAAVMAFVITKNLMVGPIVFLPAYALCYFITNRDKRFVEILMTKVRKCSPVANRSFWGGNAYWS